MNFTIKPVFSFSIDIKLSDSGVTIGKYDGIHSSLTAVTQGNKVKKDWFEKFSEISVMAFYGNFSILFLRF